MSNFEVGVDDLRQTQSSIFFIVGTSRSGSTLLQSMLNMHSHITIPPETHFFNSYDKIKRRLRKKNGSYCINDVINYWYDNKTRILDLKLSSNNIKEYAKKLELTTPFELYNLHLTMYRLQRDKAVVGEKTPRHIRHVDTILDLYPEAKIIALFRDPRATANSEINAQFGSPSVMITTQRWRKYVKIHNHLSQSLPESKYLMIQYRDMIKDPKLILKQVVSFLGWEFEPKMLHYYKRSSKEQGFTQDELDWKNETLEPLKTDKNEKWKDQLNNWQVYLIEKTASPWLQNMGYTPYAKKLNMVHAFAFVLLDIWRSLWATVTGARDEGYIDSK